MKIPEHKYFFTINGKKATNLLDLRTLLSDMSESDFTHHTSNGPNDFANWLRDILHKDYLAERIQKVHSKKETIELINDEIVSDQELDVEKTNEFKRFIAKEFIYGMFFGILLGIILSRLI